MEWPPNPRWGRSLRNLQCFGWSQAGVTFGSLCRSSSLLPWRPTWRLGRAVSLGSPAAGLANPQGTQSALEPTGGARELPPEPSAGLRPRSASQGEQSLPACPPGSGAKKHPSFLSELRAPARVPGRRSAAVLRHRALRGADTSRLPAWKGRPGLAVPTPGIADPLGTTEGPGEVSRNSAQLAASRAEGSKATITPILLGRKYLFSKSIWALPLAGSACRPLCPGCQRERIT